MNIDIASIDMVSEVNMVGASSCLLRRRCSPPGTTGGGGLRITGQRARESRANRSRSVSLARGRNDGVAAVLLSDSAFAALWCVAAFEFKTHTHWRTRTHSSGSARGELRARARPPVRATRGDCFTLSSLGGVILLTRAPLFSWHLPTK